MAQRLAVEQMAADLREISKLPAGRRLLWRILEYTGPYRSTFHPESERKSIVAEARRSVGLWLIRWLMRVDPAIYPGLLAEHLPKQPVQEPLTDEDGLAEDDDQG